MARGHSTTSIARPRPRAASDGTPAGDRRRRPPRSSPENPSRRRGRTATSGDTGTAATNPLADLTTPIPVERRLFKGRLGRSWLYAAGGLLLVAFAASLFVLPVQAWMRQRVDIDRKRTELDALERANAALGNEVDALATPEGIEEAAREEIGFVRRGEIRLTVLPLPEAPATLPSGWPYDAAARIVALRGAP